MINFYEYKYLYIYKSDYIFYINESDINIQEKDTIRYTKDEKTNTVYSSDIDNLNLLLKDDLIDFADDYINYSLLSKTESIKRKVYFKRMNSFKVKTMPKSTKQYFEEKLKNGQYKSIISINKKTGKMADKLIFIPMRLNADQTEVGAVISQKELTEHVIFNDIFDQEIEKKIPLMDLLTQPLTGSQVITEDQLAGSSGVSQG